MRRALILNSYFEESRRGLARPWKLPRAAGPAYLAGALAPSEWQIRLYDEVTGGPLEDPALLGWPDLLVLTGLTNAVDRMRQLTAYARTRNPRVVVVAGGPAVRALPSLMRRVADYACHGDVEELGDVVRVRFGISAVAPEPFVPRFDLASWIGAIGHVETTRYCNFRCAFCSLSAEGRRYAPLALGDLRRHLEAAGRRRRLMFIDNNFYGNNRRSFLDRLIVVDEYRRAGYYREWGALVTADFFARADNLAAARAAGCRFLFSGVESFDAEWLRTAGKRQNLIDPQIELIRGCLESDVGFSYGLILDTTTRTVEDLRAELDFILATPTIPLPGFITLAIPLLGTPLFREMMVQRELLPNTKLRDMDGTTLVVQPKSDVGEAVTLLRDLVGLRGYRLQVLRHSLGFTRHYAGRLGWVPFATALGSAGLLCAYQAMTGASLRRSRERTHVTTTEGLDPVYRPAFPVASQYEEYFQPLMVTDNAGRPTEAILEASEKR